MSFHNFTVSNMLRDKILNVKFLPSIFLKHLIPATFQYGIQPQHLIHQKKKKEEEFQVYNITIHDFPATLLPP